MSIGNVVAMLGAGMAGYMKGKQQKADADAAAQDQEFRQWQRGQMQAQAARDDALRGKLEAAGAPVAPTMDPDSSSTGDDPTAAPTAVPVSRGSGFGGVGSDPSAQPAPVTGTYTVGGQSGLRADAASAAAEAANTPQAQAQRFADVYAKAGQPTMAMAVKKEAVQSELAGIQLDAAKQQALNQQYDQHLFAAVRKGHQGIANFLTETPGDGQGGDAKAQVIVSPDGKTVQYQVTHADGTTEMLPHQFSNDQNGAVQAAYMLSQAVTPADKLAHIQKDAELARQTKKDQNEADHWARQDSNSSEANALRLEIAGMRVAAGAGGKASKYSDMDAPTQAQYQSLVNTERDIQKTINDGLKSQTLDSSKDPKTGAYVSPQYAELQRQKVDARRQRIGFEMRQGLTDPDDVATSITNGEKDPAKIAQGIQEAYELGGKAFGDKVKAAAQPALDKLLSASGSPGGGGAFDPSAGKAVDSEFPPTDASARRVATTPPVNFAAPQRGGGNARMNAAAAKIPALTQAVAAAKANLDAAKSKGPMAVAAARDAWNTAKTALAEANLRAGNTVAEEDN